MPKTKLKTRARWIKRLKSYKNPDPRCSYPWELGNLGYCWGYASWIDYNKDGVPTPNDIPIKYLHAKDCIEFCKDCEYWKEIK